MIDWDFLGRKAEFLEKTAHIPESTIIFNLCAVTRCYPDDCPCWDEKYCFLFRDEPKWLKEGRF